MSFLENLVVFNVFYVNCRGVRHKCSATCGTFVSELESMDSSAVCGTYHLLNLLFFSGNPPIQYAFSFLVQFYAEAYHLSLVSLERFQVLVF